MRKKYGSTEVLDDASFVLHRSDVVALTGANGSGKTTLIDIVCGIVAADGGILSFEGRDISRLSLHRRAALGLRRTFQSPRVFPSATVRTNILAAFSDNRGVALTNALRRRTWSDDAANRYADMILDDLQLSHLTDVLAARLSFGQKKLLNICQVLVPAAKTVLVDEPTAGLSVDAAERVGSMIRSAAATRGVAFLIVEHNRWFIDRFCSQEYALADRRLVHR